MINLFDILDAADGQLFGEPIAQIFSGFSVNPRTVQPGELYVALKTEQADGHPAMEAAVRAGATGIMCKHPPTFDTSGVTVVMMRDVEGALLRWARYILTKYGTTVIAVAGSNGKSTTGNAIHHVLSGRYPALNGTDSLPGRFGVPLALGKLTNSHQLAVLEFSPLQSGDMDEMFNATLP
ncbi:MAG: hypothetical protein HC915_05740 [Anaerolineae bacterium]|nr:hypothetical protein [Anaerolineae bacterium]